MALPGYYKILYCYIHDKNEAAVGAGFCIDGIRIITCAHVVNAAFGQDLDAKKKLSGRVKISFPLNDDPAFNGLFSASINAWCWNEKLTKGVVAIKHKPILIRNDLAVLTLKAQPQIIEILSTAGKHVEFLQGNLQGASFECYTMNPDDPGIPQNIPGKLADVALGSITVVPDTGPHVFFFDSGSSGSPLFCSYKANIDGPQTWVGIAGYVSYLSTKDTSWDAKMVSIDAINEALQKNNTGLQLKAFNVTAEEKKIRQRQFRRKFLSSAEKVIRLNRQPQVDFIGKVFNQSAVPSPKFLIVGNKKQKLDLFVNRYRLEFLADSGEESIAKHIEMPTVPNEGLFQEQLIANICTAFAQTSNPFLNYTPEALTVSIVKDVLCTREYGDYVFNFRIDNTKFSQEQSNAYKWFFNSFLAPLFINENARPKIHVFLSLSCAVGEDYMANKDLLAREFEKSMPPELSNVTRAEIEIWLAIEEHDSERQADDRERYKRVRQRMLEILAAKNSYDMEEVDGLYRKAAHDIDNI